MRRTVTKKGQSSPSAIHDYAYADPNKNRTQDERGSYAYNARDQLVSWTREGSTQSNPGRQVTYQPNGDGAQRFTVDTSTWETTNSGFTFDVTSTTRSRSHFAGDRLTVTRSRSETAADLRGTPPGGYEPSPPTVTRRDQRYEYSTLGSLTRIETDRSPSAVDDPDEPPTIDPEDFDLTTQHTYDPFERLLSARDDKNGDGDLDDDGEAASEVYCYDALDRRDRKVAGVTDVDGGDDSFAAQRTACAQAPAASTRDYSYLGLTEALTREGQETAGTAKTYDYDPNANRLGIRARIDVDNSRSRTFRPYEQDAQGSVVAVENATGDPEPEEGETSRYRLDPFGATVNEDDLAPAAKNNPFRFQGHYLDPAVGTYDMQARAYRPALGRFLTQDRYADPAADVSLQSDPLTNNRYSFAGGSPTTRVEFDGHDSWGQERHLMDKGVEGQQIATRVAASQTYTSQTAASQGVRARAKTLYYDPVKAANAKAQAAGAEAQITLIVNNPASGLVGPQAIYDTGFKTPLRHGVPQHTKNLDPSPSLALRMGWEFLAPDTTDLGALFCSGFKACRAASMGLKVFDKADDVRGARKAVRATEDPRVRSRPATGRVDAAHDSYDAARRSAEGRVGDMGADARHMYDPETGTLIGQKSADGKRGWRIDKDHFNHWDWTRGRKGSGGVFGHDFFPQDFETPHSRHIGYAEWE